MITFSAPEVIFRLRPGMTAESIALLQRNDPLSSPAVEDGGLQMPPEPHDDNPWASRLKPVHAPHFRVLLMHVFSNRHGLEPACVRKASEGRPRNNIALLPHNTVRRWAWLFASTR